MQSLFLWFLPDAHENGAEPAFCRYSSFQTVAQIVRSCGIAESIVRNDTIFRVLKGDEMGTQFTAFPPVIKQNAGITAGGEIIKFSFVSTDFHRKIPVFKA